MKLLQPFLAASLLAVSAACGREPEVALAKLPAAGRGGGGGTVLRIPREGGTPRLYRMPGLDPSSWKTEDKLPPLQRTIGADAEAGLAFFLDRKRNTVVLDLETRRVRPQLEHVRQATVGPDGALYAVDTGSMVTQVMRRAPIRFRSKLQGKPEALYATMGGTLLGRIEGQSPAIEVLGSDQPPEIVPTPAGPVTTSFWGDLVAVAADSAVVIYESGGKHERRSIPVSGHARAVLFSPSGHRIYVARDDSGLLVLDRFSGDELFETDLPGPARALRADPYGQWLLVRPAAGDSAWVVDVGSGRFMGAAKVEWDDDLPAVVPPGTLLTRRGRDVVALDLGAKNFPERGSLDDGAADTWLALAWHPAQEAGPEEEADSALLAVDADSGKGAASVFLQVSSSQNPSWANELSQRLKAAGLPASVLEPRRSDEAYRVVLG
ncbi:MAG: hypothetical protein ACAI18_15685, partial [Gemmatimonadales bacterium]